MRLRTTCLKAGEAVRRSYGVRPAHGLIFLLDPAPKATSTRTVWPRQLISIANRPLVQYAVAALQEACTGKIVVVTEASDRSEVSDALASTRCDNLEIRSAAGHGLAAELDALRQVSCELRGDPLLVHRGDSLVGSALSSEVSRYLETGVDAAVLYFGTETGNGGPRHAGEPRAKRTAVEPLGIEFLSAALVEALAGRRGARASGQTLSDRIVEAGSEKWLVDQRVVANGWRLDKTVDNLLEGNRLALDDLVADWHPDSTLRSRIEGRVKIHPSSRIEDALVRGPCVIGADVVVRHAYIGPYTSVGNGCLIENAELENSLIMNDATIRDIGWRLEHSLVGARAQLSRDFRVPKAVHLDVGDDARISVS
jgi:glucose-1-phosphate thymidylyltransferase